MGTLTTSLNDVEKKFSTLSDDFEQYKISKEHSISILTNKLNASEEIVKQLFPGIQFYIIYFYFLLE